MLPGIQQHPDLSREGAGDDACKRGTATDAGEVLLGLGVLHRSSGVQCQILVWLDRRRLSVEFRARCAWLYPESHLLSRLGRTQARAELLHHRMAEQFGAGLIVRVLMIRHCHCHVSSNSDFMA
ncbi:hypothetical protein WN982_15675 [Paraburkholderia sp. IMGN_8]|uniref:hypothetical protein n=1 Tax=Paraburkholderia sp. IMGN_8 TaxID=3136564 RepID=UPI003101549B